MDLDFALEHLPRLLKATKLTIQLTLLSLFFGIFVGIFFAILTPILSNHFIQPLVVLLSINFFIYGKTTPCFR